VHSAIQKSVFREVDSELVLWLHAAADPENPIP